MASVGIVIRARNEERWIGKVLEAIRMQEYSDYEVVLVDNSSTDNTVGIFKNFFPESPIITVDEFKPGRSINIGIKACQCEYVVVLSAHCIPVSETWLRSFVDLMDNPKIAAAYGRQIPLPSSHPLDKRDLLNTFGIERRIQKRDSFFHNANSIVRRSVWEQFSFDEDVKHIEDRIWAETIIEQGFWIGYEPDASAYHYHGIYHHDDHSRAAIISEILSERTLERREHAPWVMDAGKSKNLYCILGYQNSDHDKLERLVEYLSSSCPPGEIYVPNLEVDLSDPKLNIRRSDCKFDREATFVDILRSLLRTASENKYYPDSVVYLNLKVANIVLHDLKQLINTFYSGSYDSVFLAEPEFSNAWVECDGVYQSVRSDFTPREFKNPMYLARYGLGTVTRPEFVRGGELVGSNVAIVKIGDLK